MATTSAPAAGRGFDLKRKIGPLPVWAWGLIGTAGGYLAIRYYRNAKAAKAAATSTTTAVPASSSPQSYNGLSGGIGGGWSGGAPWTTTPSAEPTATPAPTSTLPAQSVSVAPALLAPAPTPLPTAEGMARMLQGAGIGSSLSPAQANALSVLYQPQNQPSVNPNVSAAPVTQIQEGGSLPPASGIGQRFITPGAPYAFTAG